MPFEVRETRGAHGYSIGRDVVEAARNSNLLSLLTTSTTPTKLTIATNDLQLQQGLAH